MARRTGIRLPSGELREPFEEAQFGEALLPRLSAFVDRALRGGAASTPEAARGDDLAQLAVARLGGEVECVTQLLAGEQADRLPVEHGKSLRAITKGSSPGRT